MIRKETNVTFNHCPNKVFERVVSDIYYLREKSTGHIYSEAVNISLNIEDFEEVLDMPLVVEENEE